MLVDDDRFFAQRIAEMLNDRGLQVKQMSNVQDALSGASDEYAAFLIDVMLPNDPAASGISDEESRAGHLSGVALARKLKVKHPSIPIILFSASDSNEAKQWAQENEIRFVRKSDGSQVFLKAASELGLFGKAPPHSHSSCMAVMRRL